MIRGIIFDCFGVLCHGSLQYLRSITPPEHLQELGDLSHSSDYGYVSHTEYSQRVGALLGRSAQEIDEITGAQCIRDERAIELVRSLRGDYKTALLSNIGRGRIDMLFTPEELKGLFDAVVLSNEVGMVKPNATIYELAASRLGLPADECIMIDDIAINVMAAEAAGMHGLQCKSAEQCEVDLRNMLGKTNARVA